LQSVLQLQRNGYTRNTLIRAIRESLLQAVQKCVRLFRVVIVLAIGNDPRHFDERIFGASTEGLPGAVDVRDEVLQFDKLVGAFAGGDVITIDTRPGSRSINLTREGITSSVLASLDQTSTWISLQKGDNQFGAFTPGAGIPFTMVYTPQYGAL